MEIYFDGGCSPNPGRMSSCIVACPTSGDVQPYTMKNLGHGTNNVAEWSGLIWATVWAKDNGILKCTILGDSKLVICQALRQWKINKPELAALAEQYWIAAQGMEIELRHVRREFNLAGIFLEHGTL